MSQKKEEHLRKAIEKYKKEGLSLTKIKESLIPFFDIQELKKMYGLIEEIWRNLDNPH